MKDRIEILKKEIDCKKSELKMLNENFLLCCEQLIKGNFDSFEINW